MKKSYICLSFLIIALNLGAQDSCKQACLNSKELQSVHAEEWLTTKRYELIKKIDTLAEELNVDGLAELVNALQAQKLLQMVLYKSDISPIIAKTEALVTYTGAKIAGGVALLALIPLSPVVGMMLCPTLECSEIETGAAVLSLGVNCLYHSIAFNKTYRKNAVIRLLTQLEKQLPL